MRSPFLGPRGQMGGKRGSKLSISLKMMTRSCKFVQICNFIWEIRWSHPFLTYYNFLPFLGHPRGQIGGQNGQKVPISLQITTKSCKFAQTCNFIWEIRWWHPFLTYYNFWPFLGHPRGQMRGPFFGPKRAQIRKKIAPGDKWSKSNAGRLHTLVVCGGLF